jgi:hypothetical protein
MKMSTTCLNRNESKPRETALLVKGLQTYGIDVNKRSRGIADELLSQLGRFVWVDPDNVPKEDRPVGLVIHLFGVQQDLVELTGLGEAGDDLVGDMSAKVDRECKVVVPVLLDQVSEFLTAIELRSL